MKSVKCVLIWSRSINGDAVDCKSAAFGHAWFDPRILHQMIFSTVLTLLNMTAIISLFFKIVNSIAPVV